MSNPFEKFWKSWDDFYKDQSPHETERSNYNELKKEFFCLCEKQEKKAEKQAFKDRDKLTGISPGATIGDIHFNYQFGAVNAFRLVQGERDSERARTKSSRLTNRSPTKKHVLGKPWTAEELQEKPWRCLTSDMTSNKPIKEPVILDNNPLSIACYLEEHPEIKLPTQKQILKTFGKKLEEQGMGKWRFKKGKRGEKMIMVFLGLLV